MPNRTFVRPQLHRRQRLTGTTASTAFCGDDHPVVHFSSPEFDRDLDAGRHHLAQVRANVLASLPLGGDAGDGPAHTCWSRGGLGEAEAVDVGLRFNAAQPPFPDCAAQSRERLSRELLILRLAALRGQPDYRPRERERLLHELQIHQVELELQNLELQESQAELEASRNRYADLYDFAPGPYLTFDTNGVILEANLAAAALLGRERAHLVGVPFLALAPGIDTAAFAAHVRRCRETDTRVTGEFSFTAHGSGHVEVQAVSMPALDPMGRRIGIRTMFTDIGDRKRAEAEHARAAELERNVRAQFESLERAGIAITHALALLPTTGPGPMLQLIAEHARLVLNSEFSALIVAANESEQGFETATYSGALAYQAVALGRALRAAGLPSALMREGKTTRVSDVSQHPAFVGVPQNHPPMGSFLGVPIRFGGRLLGHLCAMNKRDAPEFSCLDAHGAERLAEHVGCILQLARLHEVETRDLERLHLLARAGDVVAATLNSDALHQEMARLAVPWLADCCLVAVPDGDTLRIVSVAHGDPETEASLREAHRGLRICPEDPGIFAEAWRTRRPSVLVETTFPSSGGSMLGSLSEVAPGMSARSVLVVPMVAGGERLGLIGLLYGESGRRYEPRDLPIAEEIARRCVLALQNARLYDEVQKAVEARDRELEAAQAAIAVREGVLRVVAHDLRSPLGGVRLLAELLHRQTNSGDDPARRPLEMLRNTVDQMDRLIQDLLDVARLDGGTLPLHRGAVAVHSIVAEAVEAHRLCAAESGIEIAVEVAGQPPSVFADRTRLLQAFDNLICNAIKFSVPGGRITLRAAQSSPGCVVFSVQDSGTGIPSEHIPHLFEKFWQGCRTDRRGAGLGLSIVKGIADAHDGRVWVESQFGSGSTFHLAIPHLVA